MKVAPGESLTEQGLWSPSPDWCNNSFLCICNARLYYAVLQIQAKSSSVIRFLIPLTLIASQKLYTYSMCLVLETQGKRKVMKYFLHSGQKIEKQGKQCRGNKLRRDAGQFFKDCVRWLDMLCDAEIFLTAPKFLCRRAHLPAVHSLALDFDTLIVFLIVCPQIIALKRMRLRG